MSKKFSTKLRDPLYFLSKYEFLQTANYTMPDELLKYIYSWEKIKKSPYNNTSYYNCEKSWNMCEDGGIRVSDHWNFESHCNTHCITDIKVENNKYWYVGIYDSNTKTYKIIKRYPIIEKCKSEFLKECWIEEKKKIKPSESEIEKGKQFKQDIKDGKIGILLDGEYLKVTHCKYHYGDRYIKVQGREDKIYIDDNQEFINESSVVLC